MNGATGVARLLNIIPGEAMNAFSSEELMQFYKSNVSIFFSLASEAFEGAQKLAELNLQAGRSVLAESVARLHEMKPDTSSADWLASPLRLAQSAAGKTLSYQQHVNDIALEVQSASSRIVEAQYDQFSRDVQARIDNWARHAPAGSETAVIALKSAFSTASDAAETVRKSVRSVVEVAQANVSAMAARANGNAASQPGARAGKA
jgi:phasin family protein